MASVLKLDKLDPQSGTALEIGTSGDTITIPSGATLDISSATLTPPATMPASSGINFTALNATNLGSGTVPTARLGTGTASSSTVLYGDQTYKAEPGGGKILQVVQATATTAKSTASTTDAASGVSVSITPSATTSKVLVLVGGGEMTQGGGTAQGSVEMYSQTGGGGYALLFNVMRNNVQDGNAIGQNMSNAYLHTSNTTSQVDYQLYFKTTAETFYINYNGHIVITAMEIGA